MRVVAMRPLHLPLPSSVPIAKPLSEDHQQASKVDDRPCYLLQLPAELRNRIYEEATVCKDVLWVDPEGIPIDRMREDLSIKDRRLHYLPSEPALTRTCRKIRKETLPIFYGRNVFCDTPVDLCCVKFLVYLTKEKRRMLQNLRITHWWYFATNFLHLEGGPPGMCVQSVRDRLERMHAWLERNNVHLGDGAVHFPMKLRDDGDVIWTNDPTGTCEMSCCKRAETTSQEVSSNV